YKYILVVVNKFRKMQYFILVEGLLIKELVEKFIDCIYTFYSLLDIIVFSKRV
ncbi:hypothetical protein NEUTE2DRAFT_50061, partial [Neurospora tetrasperma FGSC 2509]